jgi:hypothetical protein
MFVFLASQTWLPMGQAHRGALTSQNGSERNAVVSSSLARNATFSCCKLRPHGQMRADLKCLIDR